jgi:hypothetical protein
MARKTAMMSGLGVVLLCCVVGGCSHNVEGNTYANNGSAVRLEFQSGGKAQVAFGAMNRTCNWTERNSRISLSCEGDTTVFTENSDGSLSGHPDGMLARLEKVKS